MPWPWWTSISRTPRPTGWARPGRKAPGHGPEHGDRAPFGPSRRAAQGDQPARPAAGKAAFPPETLPLARTQADRHLARGQVGRREPAARPQRDPGLQGGGPDRGTQRGQPAAAQRHRQARRRAARVAGVGAALPAPVRARHHRQLRGGQERSDPGLQHGLCRTVRLPLPGRGARGGHLRPLGKGRCAGVPARTGGERGQAGQPRDDHPAGRAGPPPAPELRHGDQHRRVGGGAARVHFRHLRGQAAGGTAAPVPEDGGARHPGRGHRPRLQQHPGRHSRLCRDHRVQRRAGVRPGPAHQGDHPGGQAGA